MQVLPQSKFWDPFCCNKWCSKLIDRHHPHLCKAFKGVDTLFVEDVAAAQQDLVFVLEILPADDALTT